MKRKIRTGIAAAVGMMILILDTKTAISGAQEGVSLCLMTVVPSLLPFIFLSSLLTSSLTGTRWRSLRLLGRLLRMPEGSESIFLIGALGGYPTGAQAVSAAYTDGQLTKKDARRMLGFCSNAGPAFLFGIAASSFSDGWSPCVLWFIHLLAAVTAGILLPGGTGSSAALKPIEARTVPQALRQSVSVMAQICGWIVIFRVILAFTNRWFLWFLGAEGQIFLNGFAELTIGCNALSYIPCEGLRFILCAAFLGFGGLCVAMQTVSVSAPIGLGMYLPGKLLQCTFSVIAAGLYQQLVFSPEQRLYIHPLIYLAMAGIILLIKLLLQKREKKCSIPAAVGV